MHTFVKRHAIWTWIAALAILFSALAPAISHAMATGAGQASQLDPAMEVCTMLGMKTVRLAAPGKPEPGKFDHLAHCGYCAVHAAPALLPPPAPCLNIALDTSSAYPPLFYRSATPLFAWSPARPRGPPASS